MILRLLIAIVALSISSASASAQSVELFWSFGQGADVSNIATVNVNDGTGTAFVFARLEDGFEVEGFDLDFTNSDNSVIRITSGEVLNPLLTVEVPNVGPIDLGRRFNTVDGQPLDIIPATLNGDGTGTLFGVAIMEAVGVDSMLELVDPFFDTDVDAFLLARVEYEILAAGQVELSLSQGENPFIDLRPVGEPDVVLTPTFQSGFLTVVPEPSSAGLLVLGLAGIVARRRR